MSSTVIAVRIGSVMGRWQPDAAGRLQQAALELYATRGYDATTVAEISQRAGLTERTFFRHFADKREVLFRGSEELQQLIVEAVESAPSSSRPLEALAAGLQAADAVFDADRRPHSRTRQAVIGSTPELQERELIKLASLAGALADALRHRGVEHSAAELAAQAGIAVFRVAFEHWLNDDSGRTFADSVSDAFAELRAVTAD